MVRDVPLLSSLSAGEQIIGRITSNNKLKDDALRVIEDELIRLHAMLVDALHQRSDVPAIDMMNQVVPNYKTGNSGHYF